MPDVPTRRRPPPSWTKPITERLTPAVKVLVIIEAAMFAFVIFVKPMRAFVAEHLAAGPGFFRGELWQPATALVVHAADDLWGFIFNIIGLWFVGALIERTRGTSRFLKIFFIAGISAHVAMILLSRLLPYGAVRAFAGSSYAILALFVAFGRIYNRQPTQVFGALTLEARQLTWILVVWSLLADIFRFDWAGLLGTIVAAVLGFVLTGDGIAEMMSDWRDRLKARRLRRRYRVIDGGQKPPRNRNRYVN